MFVRRLLASTARCRQHVAGSPEASGGAGGNSARQTGRVSSTTGCRHDSAGHARAGQPLAALPSGSGLVRSTIRCRQNEAPNMNASVRSWNSSAWVLERGSIRAASCRQPGRAMGGVGRDPCRRRDHPKRGHRPGSRRPGARVDEYPGAPVHAEGGAIVAGDTVDVIAQSGSAQPADPAGIQYIAQGLKVLTVANTRTGGVLATSPDLHRGGRRQGHRVPVGLRAGCRRRGLVSWHPGGPHHRRNVRTLT